ncbi:MAG: hypothetical protein KAU89_03015 [Candidatus Thorarchaeota archaeon]|nr:hypothetical protein [Candidatus Thorarchaeota archaeon]
MKPFPRLTPGTLSGRDIDLKQVRLTDTVGDKTKSKKASSASASSVAPTRLLDFDLTGLTNESLWPILVETARRSPLYANLTGYIREEILPKEPEVSVRELASRLSISVGEALVILYDIHKPT